jgi:hypothetical protein
MRDQVPIIMSEVFANVCDVSYQAWRRAKTAGVSENASLLNWLYLLGEDSLNWPGSNLYSSSIG